jgi:4a-hydroxytetrahydrobiopterin dehydratase
MQRKKLTSEEIGTLLTGTNGWKVDGEYLHKRFEFANFAESLAFVNKVGEIAEAADHHPDITFGWGYAELRTMTHDRGGITDVDFDLIGKIDQLGSAH